MVGCLLLVIDAITINGIIRNYFNYKLRERKNLKGIQISQVRWPVELYEWLQETAYQKRQSINKTVIGIVESVRKQQKEAS